MKSDGFSEGYLGFSAGEEEVVAAAGYPGTCPGGSAYHTFRRLGRSALYIHGFLAMTTPEKQRIKDLETMIVLAGGLLAVHLLFGYRLPAYLALLTLITAAALPGLSARIAGVWGAFSAGLGRVNSRILLTLIFYLVLTPVALLNRFFSGGDPLMIKKSPADGGYWHERDKTYGPQDLEKTW